MFTEYIFVVFIFIPFIILGLILSFIQQKFLKKYREVFPETENPISVNEFTKLYKQNPSKAYSFLKNNFFSFVFSRSDLYFKKYSDSSLNDLARLIQVLTIGLFFFPFIGILLLFINS